jgi:MFS family permease
MSAYGIADAASSMLLGRLADLSSGKKLVFVVAALAHLSFYVFFLFFLQWHPMSWFDQNPWSIYIAAAVYGVGDAALNTLPAILFGIYFASKTDIGFAHMKFWQAAGTVLVLLITSQVSFQIILVLGCGLFMMSALSLAVLDRLVPGGALDRRDPAKEHL